MNGLSDRQVALSRERYGTNELEVRKGASFFEKLIKNLGDPIIKILIAAFFITVFFSGSGGFYEAIGIAVSIVVSTVVSTLSEYGSEKAFRKMQKEASEHKCEVIRNGKGVLLSAQEIVVGDAVAIKAGDKIGADGILINGMLSCNMAALNGESADVRKEASESSLEIGEPTDKYTMLRGATVTSGKGIMLVKAVGASTYYGKIAGEVQNENGESPLRQKLTVLAKTLSKFGYFCAVCVVLAYILNSVVFNPQFVFSTKNVLLELLHSLTLGVSVVVVAVPEGLPMMITVVLSSNMIRMQKQGIRVRKPVGIETAGNVEILFTDKTGTLTYGEPRVISYISGSGVRSKRSADMADAERFLLGATALYAGESRIENGLDINKRRAVMGDVTDRALLSEYLECGDLPRGIERQAYLPFDSRIKLCAANVKIDGNVKYHKAFGDELTVIKGAPEILIKYCKNYYAGDGKRKELDQSGVMKEIAALSAKGVRTLAVITTRSGAKAVQRIANGMTDGDTPSLSELFEDACFFTLVAIRDELRREAPKAVRALQKAGVQTVMITGDSKGTAVAIAKEAGIISGTLYETVLESSELRALSDDEVKELLPSLRVVARALPDDKSRLVRLAKENGRITAMTGDGLNDAPALRAADVGFSMGSGTDVAKEAGDVIISNNDISSIERAVLYGRTIFRSIRKFVVFQLVMNLSAVAISIIAPFIGFENPVTVMQMLWINLIMDTVAAIAFAGEAPLKKYMKEPPLPKTEPVLNGDMLTRIFVMGVFTVMICLFYLHSERISELFSGRGSPEFMSGFFALFVFCGIFGAFCARSGRVNILSGLFSNPVFIVIIAAVFASQIAMIYFGGELFRCVPLSFTQLKTTVLMAFSVVPFGVLTELVMRIVPADLKVKRKAVNKR